MIVYIDYDVKKTLEKGGTFSIINNDMIIKWNPNVLLKTDNGTILFPATILAHEGAHALQYIKYGDKKYKEKKREKTPNIKINLKGR